MTDHKSISDRKILAIIPARGGSQRVPRKNLAELNGKPLIAWTIADARRAKFINRIIVSTDDDEIAAVSRGLDAEVVDRPADISGHMANSESALIHVLEHLHNTEVYIPDLVVFLQATSPLRDETDIDSAIKTLLTEDADSLFSAGPIPGFAWTLRDGLATPVNYDPRNRPRTQDLMETIVAENGSIYVFKPEVLLRTRCRLGGKIAVHEQQPINCYEIDYPSDIEWIEKLMAIAPDVPQ